MTVVFLSISVAVWWQIWTGHPTSDLTCGCGDPALFVSSFGWVAHAIAHGQNPFLDTAVFHGDGLNLLSNTSGFLEAFLLTPVTWLFGPVAGLNVANTLAPVASAGAVYWAARHTLRIGRLAALVAGVMVEVSPAVVGSVSTSHLQIALLAFVPLIGVSLHELFVRQSGSAFQWGSLLALAVVGQFFAGTELLVLVAMFAVLVGVLAGTVAAANGVRRRPVAARLGFAVRGVAVALAGAGAALAYPAWYALAGPRHFAGQPWSGLMELSGGQLGTIVRAPDPHAGHAWASLSGYSGLLGAPESYLGLGAVFAGVAAVVLLYRRPMVWALSAIAFIAGWLSLGATYGGRHPPSWVPFLPWAALDGLPLLRNVLAQNFAVFTVLAVAALAALLVDWLAGFGRGWLRLPAAGLAVAVAVGALVPLASTWALPLETESVAVPTWFAREAPRLPAGSTVLTVPFTGGDGEAVVWQAIGGMHVTLAGGYGLVPGADGHVDHGTAPGSATAVLAALDGPANGARPALDDLSAVTVVRRALTEWGVTTVVVIDRTREAAYAIQWLTALFGRPPTPQDGAAVWMV